MLKFLKLFSAVIGGVGSATSLLVSNDPTEVNYVITKDMVKHIKYHDFNQWSSIPWNSAYFDLDQPDLKIVSGLVVSNQYSLSMRYDSTVSGVDDNTVVLGTGVSDLTKDELNIFARILFNHNFVDSKNYNYIQFFPTDEQSSGQQFQVQLNLEINKPLSFYIQAFNFYFNYWNFATFSGYFQFSFLDFAGNVEYIFKGQIDNNIYNNDLYNFVSMPARVPNLKHLSIDFSVYGSRKEQYWPGVYFGQMNIFSTEDINPVPPISPFSPDYERAPWYDIFAQLRNAFRWAIYGVVGKVLPVEPLRQFLQTVDTLLRRMFDDTISSVLPFDFVSTLENIIPLWLFIRAISMIIG